MRHLRQSGRQLEQLGTRVTHDVLQAPGSKVLLAFKAGARACGHSESSREHVPCRLDAAFNIFNFATPWSL
jgi:hypothetical protein